jgi:hypothetical protein
MSDLWLPWPTYVDLAASLALVARLLQNGLYRVYRFFFAYLAADAMETLLAVLFQTRLQWYANLYLVGQTVKIILAVFLVLEVYQLALEHHPALAQFIRNSIVYVLAVAAGLAALGIALDRYIPPGRSVIVHRFNTFERTMDICVLALLVLVVVFMTWFPVRLRRNGALYIGGIIIYFASRSAGLLLRNLAPEFKRPIDHGILIAAILCLSVWLMALTREGEKITTVVGHRWQPAEATRLAAQLDAINARLLRLSRR